MRVLAIVESPLQLLCAYEMICTFPGEYRLLLRLSDVDNNNNQMLFIAAGLELNFTSFRLRKGKVGRDLANVSVMCAPFQMRRYDYLFLGDYFSDALQRVAKRVGARHTYFLDDGVATFKAQQQIQASGVLSDLATFFQVDALPGQNILHHSFQNLCEKRSPKESYGSIFLGQPLVEKGLLTLETYLALVRRAVDAGDGNLLYFPHRHEDGETIREIERMEGVEVRYPKACIEYHLLSEGVCPATITGGPSSAMFSLPLIYPEMQLNVLVPEFLQNERTPYIKNTVDKLRHMANARVITVPG